MSKYIYGLPIVGIYAVINKKTKRCYVGKSKHIAKRKKQHIKALKNGNHHCRDMQKEFDKTGMQYFKFVILETFDFYVSNNDLLKRERYWFETLKAELNMVVPGTEFKRNDFKEKEIDVRKFFNIKPINYADKQRPEWHAWVYGGGINPNL